MDRGESLFEAEELGGFVTLDRLDRTEERQISDVYIVIQGSRHYPGWKEMAMRSGFSM